VKVAVIPARWGSTRFPGKPLAFLAGKPMIQHVFERVQKVSSLNGIFIATDDSRIARTVESFGGRVIMTGECRTGTDRVWSAVESFPVEVVLNVQGDEPLIDPKALESLLEVFADQTVQMATLRRPLEVDEESDPNVVKVVCDIRGNALCFSRATIPYFRHGAVARFAHVGIYAYRKKFLQQVASLHTTPLEQAESLEQLRVLEHGLPIRVLDTAYRCLSVDTPDDLRRAEDEFARQLL
jgi:3-deoxy-manno-octulosonate cytidylyltransferase (CMP-KDO synthetase)